jgi:hypothetical protein
MKTWESIIKDKLERIDATLPENLFTEFLTRLDASGSPAVAVPAVRPAAWRRPLLRALVPAAAAGLAAVLLLHKPSLPGDGIQVAQQPPAPVAAVADTVKSEEPLQSDNLVSQAITPKAANHYPVHVTEPETTDNTQPSEDTAEVIPAEEGSISETDVVSDPEPSVSAPSPVIPKSTAAKPVELKVAPAAGIVTGGGLLAAILTPLIGSGTQVGTNSPILDMQGGYGPPDMVDYSGSFASFTDEDSHHFPLFKEGLSVGIPVAPRLKITTGLEYSRYISTSSYMMNSFGVHGFQVERKQVAQYLGIPVRLDWSLAKNRLLDVYVGGGAAADYCIGAKMIIKYTDPALKDSIQGLRRDGFVFSLIGAGGIQFNATKRIGLYLEPELTWSKPPKKPSLDFYGDIVIMEEGDYRLETYRTAHPFMFTVATGLRINLGTRY